MPKLIQLNVSANTGSTGNIAEGIGKAAMSRGWESLIVYGRHANLSESKLQKIGSESYVYIHYAKNRLLDGEGLGSKQPTGQLIKIISEYKPDVIQLHNIHDHWLNYPILFKYLVTVQTPVVWTFHDCWAFTGGCYHFENDNCYKWIEKQCKGKCIQGHFRSFRNFSLKEQLLCALGKRLNIVCVSEWITKFASQSFLGASASIHTIRNGIDTNSVFRFLGEPKGKMVLGVSNIWPKYKGLNDFIELRKLLPDDIGIILVGLNGNQIKSLPKGIKGLRRTSNVEELSKLYREVSVFVNPTHNDTFPTVNLEALACGTPVVTYRTGGSPEAIDKSTGIVVEKGNIAALAEAVLEVLDNPQNFPSGVCRARAELHFDKDKQFGQYIDLYESLLAKK